MQMYEFLGPTPSKPSRTSNFEALITFHEMGHYITNRLVGNSNGLTNVQGGAMGEGWGDFFAICMTSQSTDNFATGTFAVGGWTDLMANFKENYYFSIRRYPYSADMAKNPLTFKHIANNVVLPVGPTSNPIAGGPNNEVHNAGEVWCAVLWEVFVKLVAKHGHSEAEKRMLAYVVGGLKGHPFAPDIHSSTGRDHYSGNFAAPRGRTGSAGGIRQARHGPGRGFASFVLHDSGWSCRKLHGLGHRRCHENGSVRPRRYA